MLGVSRKKTRLAVAFILIFLSAMSSIWVYRVASVMRALEMPAAEMEKAVSCLQSGFDPCAASHQVKEIVAYRLFSLDKILLVIISFVMAKGFVRVVFGEGARRLPCRDLWGLFFLFFGYFVIVQYSSVLIKNYMLGYLQSMWFEQGMDVLQQSCMKGGATTNCGLVKKWLYITSLKMKVLNALSFLLLAIASVALELVAWISLRRKL